jgi:hypothetical protein
MTATHHGHPKSDDPARIQRGYNKDPQPLREDEPELRR